MNRGRDPRCAVRSRSFTPPPPASPPTPGAPIPRPIRTCRRCRRKWRRIPRSRTSRCRAHGNGPRPRRGMTEPVVPAGTEDHRRRAQRVEQRRRARRCAAVVRRLEHDERGAGSRSGRIARSPSLPMSPGSTIETSPTRTSSTTESSLRTRCRSQSGSGGCSTRTRTVLDSLDVAGLDGPPGQAFSANGQVVQGAERRMRRHGHAFPDAAGRNARRMAGAPPMWSGSPWVMAQRVETPRRRGHAAQGATTRWPTSNAPVPRSSGSAATQPRRRRRRPARRGRRAAAIAVASPCPTSRNTTRRCAEAGGTRSTVQRARSMSVAVAQLQASARARTSESPARTHRSAPDVVGRTSHSAGGARHARATGNDVRRAARIDDAGRGEVRHVAQRRRAPLRQGRHASAAMRRGLEHGHQRDRREIQQQPATVTRPKNTPR